MQASVAAFSWLDPAIACIVLASLLVGLLRGLVREAFALGSWILAGWAAWLLAPRAAGLFGAWIADPRLQVVAAGGAIFILGVLALGVLSALLAKLVAGIGLRGLDRALGGLFGALRGVVIIAGLVLLLQAMQFDQSRWWRDSRLVGVFEQPARVLAVLVDRLVADFMGRGKE